MAQQYLARVELHYATDQDYDRLHDHMAGVGFGRSIWLNGMGEHWLPTGTYVTSSEKPLQGVFADAQQAANRTGKTNELIVAVAPGTLSGGLKKK